MSIRVTSKALATAYVIFGVGSALVIGKFSSIFAELKSDPPPFTKAVLAFGAAGSLIICSMLACRVVWKDSWGKPRIPNSVFAIMLAAILLILARALFVTPI
jgi:hypothetical protein